MQSDDTNHDCGRGRHQSLSKTLSRQAVDESQVYFPIFFSSNFYFWEAYTHFSVIRVFILILQQERESVESFINYNKLFYDW